MLRIVITDEHKIFCEALCGVLSSDPMLRVIEVCHDFDCAIAMAEGEQPDIVFLDGSLDPTGAIDTIKTIRSLSKAIVIAFSIDSDPVLAGQLINAGAAGCLPKSAPASEIINVVKTLSESHFN